MKIFGIVMKVVVALAAVAGAVYLAATYGERVVAWAKKTLNRGECECCCDCDCDCDECDFDCDCEECDCDCDCNCECECCDEAAEEVAEEAATAEEVDFEA